MSERCSQCDRADCPWFRLGFYPAATPKSVAAEGDCQDRAVDWRARALAAEAVIEALPHCIGEWVGGSGGHRKHVHNCKRIAVWYSDQDGYGYCDDHVADHERNHPQIYGGVDAEWADAARAWEAARKARP